MKGYSSFEVIFKSTIRLNNFLGKAKEYYTFTAVLRFMFNQEYLLTEIFIINMFTQAHLLNA